MMERRVMLKHHARCGAGENSEKKFKELPIAIHRREISDCFGLFLFDE